MREVIAALGEYLERPLGVIREAMGALPDRPETQAARPHVATALTMCDDVATLTRRYLEYIEQVQALAVPRLVAVRPDELLGELDRHVMPEAFDRGVAWNCGIEGPIRPILTDRELFLEAMLEWASLVVESAGPGDSVALLLCAERSGDGDPRIGLSVTTTAEHLISDLTGLREDPLFNRLVCLDEVGTDVGSRLALCLERLMMLGAEVRFDPPEQGVIRSARILFPGASAPSPH